MQGTLSDIVSKITPVLKRHGVLRAAIFGSYARGEAAKGSDIDVLVELGEGKTLFDLVELKLDLEEAVGKSIDLLTYNALHPALRSRILAEQVAIL